jgi:uncharacterized protein YcbK (DUF882 family)
MSLVCREVDRRQKLSQRCKKFFASTAMAAVMVAGLWMGFGQPALSGGETRTISLYHVHTGESLTITYMKDGKYIPSAMKKINYLMRDWRRNEVITIDPKTINLMWELHEDLGSKRPIHIVCGYRSPRTNAFLKKIGRNVARKSQHMVGKAIDLYFPDVPSEKIRNSALVRQVGGVGYYRSGGGPTGFVHIDSGHIRHWGPAISNSQMAKIMRDYKKTVGARRGKWNSIEVPEDDGLPTSDGPFQTAEAKGKKQKIPLETAYSTEDDDLAEMAETASKQKDKSATAKAEPNPESDDVADASEEVAGDVVKAYPVPKPRPKPIEVLMLAAVNMEMPADAMVEPAAAPAPSFEGKAKSSPVTDSGVGVVISAETMREVSSEEQTSNTDAKASFAAQLRDGTAEDVPMIKPISTASAAGHDIFWFQQIIFNSDEAVRRDGAPQPFADSIAGLLPGIDEAEAAPTAAMPRLAVASMQEVAVGKGDMLVVNREGKGSLLMDAPAVVAKTQKLGQLEPSE